MQQLKTQITDSDNEKRKETVCEALESLRNLTGRVSREKETLGQPKFEGTEYSVPTTPSRILF